MKSFLNLTAYFFVFFSILLFSYIFYKSEILDNVLGFAFYWKFYIVSLFLFILSLIYFFLNSETKLKIFLITVSTFFSIYFVEIFINPLNKYLSNRNFVDKRSFVQVFNDYKKIDENVTFPVRSVDFLSNKNLANDSLIPLGGISFSTTIHCNENGFWTFYKSDRYGFNNPDNVWEKNEIDFLLIGDSYAHGNCVKIEDSIAGNLRSLGSSVLNLGYSGNGPLSEYASLKEYLPKINTKKVLWIYYEGNDLSDLGNEISNKNMQRYLNRSFSQNLIYKQKEIDKKANLILKEKINQAYSKKEKTWLNEIDWTGTLKLKNLRLNLGNLFKINLVNFTDFNATSKQNIITFSKILYLSKEFTEEHNAELIFVYLPAYYRYMGEPDSKKLYGYEKILKAVKSLNIPIIDIHNEVFKQHDDPLSLFPFKRFGHYTSESYEKIVKTIDHTIRK